MKKEFLKPGIYRVRATIRATVVVEEGEDKTEVDLVYDAVLDPSSETVDWDVQHP